MRSAALLLFACLACHKEPASSGDAFVDFHRALAAGRRNPSGGYARGVRVHRVGERGDARFLTGSTWSRVPIARSRERTRIGVIDGVQVLEIDAEGGLTVLLAKGAPDDIDRATIDRWTEALETMPVEIALPDIAADMTGGIIELDSEPSPTPPDVHTTGLGNGPPVREGAFFADRPFLFVVRNGAEIRALGRIDHPSE